MPRSAIESGWADFCLPPAGIAQELARISQHPLPGAPPSAPAQQVAGRACRSSSSLMRAAFGNDLSYYKPTHDRAPHRAPHGAAQASRSWTTTSSSCRPTPTSCAAVQGHAHRRHQLLPRPRRVRGAQDAACSRSCSSTRTRDAPIRVWVPGCATGEEAYSLAICLLECLERPRARRSRCRSSPPTSTTRRSQRARARRLPARTSRWTSRPSGCSGSSQAATAATRSHGACATWWCSRSQNVTQGPAVLAARPGLLPQPAHLPAAGAAEEGAARPPLRAAARRVPAARHVRDGGRRRRTVLARRSQEQDLSAKRNVAVDAGAATSASASQAPRRRPAIQPDVAQRPGRAAASDGATGRSARALRAAGRGHQRGLRRSSTFRGGTGPYLEPTPGARQLQHAASWRAPSCTSICAGAVQRREGQQRARGGRGRG